LPPVADKIVPQEHVELARGLFQPVEAAFEMAYLRGAIREAEGLTDVNVLSDEGVEKRSVDVRLTKIEVHGGHNGEEEAETGHAKNRREILRIVEVRALTATLGHEAGFEAEGVIFRVELDLIDPHVVADHAPCCSHDPRAIGH
jgi:hypothetical protein